MMTIKRSQKKKKTTTVNRKTTLTASSMLKVPIKERKEDLTTASSSPNNLPSLHSLNMLIISNLNLNMPTPRRKNNRKYLETSYLTC